MQTLLRRSRNRNNVRCIIINEDSESCTYVRRSKGECTRGEQCGVRTHTWIASSRKSAAGAACLPAYRRFCQYMAMWPHPCSALPTLRISRCCRLLRVALPLLHALAAATLSLGSCSCCSPCASCVSLCGRVLPFIVISNVRTSPSGGNPPFLAMDGYSDGAGDVTTSCGSRAASFSR